MRTNVKAKPIPVFTHEGGKADRIPAKYELTRTVATCMLFENTFYEPGTAIAERIVELCRKVKPSDIYDLAVYAREDLKLRHVPLFLALQFIANSRGNPAARELLTKIIKRPDEMGEIVSLYWKQGKKPLPAQLKKGLAACFHKFNEFQFAKWDSANDAIRIRDVMFLTHPKPIGPVQATLFNQIANKSLPIPKTWETELSAGKDKKTVWEDLLRSNQLGVMAFIMNLRNMDNVKVDKGLISEAWSVLDKSWALPFRYITASRHAPWFGKELNDGLLESIKNQPPLEGKTFIVVDTSGSMQWGLSSSAVQSWIDSRRGETNRMDAATSLAAVVRGIVPASRVFHFSDQWGEMPSDATGLSLVRAIAGSPQGGTMLKRSLEGIFSKCGVPERIIVITDEQSQDGIAALPYGTKGYIINVAPYQFGVGTKDSWIHINGFSERILDWIRFEESYVAS